jgi:hypothetical protein
VGGVEEGASGDEDHPDRRTIGVDQQHILDDSFHRDDIYSPVVVARMPADADLRWHGEVVVRLARKSRELKASRVLNHLSDLPIDLQPASFRIRDLNLAFSGRFFAPR